MLGSTIREQSSVSVRNGSKVPHAALADPSVRARSHGHRSRLARGVHDTFDRLHEIAAPTLVIAGAEDILTPPRYGRQVADLIPGAEFIVLLGEAHQPFQESPETFNDLVHEFWTRLGRTTK